MCPASYELSESLVLREIVFIFQGIEGQYIRYDAGVDAFKINSRVINIISPVSVILAPEFHHAQSF